METVAMSSWTTGDVEAGDVHIHYLRTGGRRPALLLLHGLTGSGGCWRPVARRLEAHFDLVMPDARGHGRSSAPLHGYRYQDHVGDLVALIRALDLEAPIVVGHSMGGLIAALAASERPELFSGVVLADPTFLSATRQREVRDGDVAERHRQALGRSPGQLVAELRVRHPRRSDEMLQLLAEARLQTRMSAFDVLTPPNPDFHQVMSAMTVPAVLILGDVPVVSRETAAELQLLNPRLRVERIAGAGHGLPYDQPEIFAAAVAAFATTLPGASATGARDGKGDWLGD